MPATDPTNAVDALRSLLAPERVLTQRLERYTVDGLVPALAVLPESVDDVAAVLRIASDRALATVPWGAGTLMDLGNRPSSYDLALDLTRLNGLVEYSPEDLVVSAQAGITLGALNEHLAQRGQFLALDTPLAEQATVGGALSTNIPGPSRLRYGTGRDLVIGLTSVLSGGEVVHSGGRVVKNVAGYDLNKLYIGALGTLGVIVEASFKLHPLPGARATLTATFQGCDGAHAAALAIVNSSFGATAVELAGPQAAAELTRRPTAGGEPAGGEWLLAVFLTGLAAAVERKRREIEAILHATGAMTVTGLGDAQSQQLYARLRDYGRSQEHPAALILRCSVLPSEVAQAVRQLSESINIPSTRLTASPGSGSLRLLWPQLPAEPDSLIAAVRLAIQAIGGTVTIERCPPQLKHAVDVWGLSGADVELMRDMRAAYDPAGILSPGRHVARR